MTARKSARQRREEEAAALVLDKPVKPIKPVKKPRAKKQKADEVVQAQEWNAYDKALRQSCIECGKMVEADLEIRRMGLNIATVAGLDKEAELYLALEDNVDRKLRGLLSAREVGSRFSGPSLTAVAVVDRKAEMLLVNVVMRWKRKQVRARIEARIDLASMGDA